MTDKEWGEVCEQEWHKAAAELEAAGYTKQDRTCEFIPAIFTKGDDRVYLARQLGSAKWYPSRQHLSEVIW